MPYSVEDVDKHKKGLTARQKRQWVEIANSVLSRCMGDGGDEAECAASAIRQANGVVGNEGAALHHYRQPASSYDIRHEVHQGRKHMVVPVVMMVEGVHNGSHGPLLHMAEDLGRFPAVWNGIPIAVQHPEEGGMNVSANQPGVIDSQVVGRVYNTFMDNGKLRAEAWLDEEAMRRISPEAMEYIIRGKPLDVSIGVFTDDEFTTGEWNGERYEAIARNHRPDHLALLPGGVGACSWADGCGVRVHKEGGETDVKTHGISYNGTESTAWSGPTLADFGVDEGRWEDLSQADRAKVASHYLVGTASAESFGDLKFPVVNPGTGRLNERALRAVIGGRGAQANITADQRVSARRTAYRLLNSEFDAGLEIPDNLMVKELAYDGFAVNEMGYRELTQQIQTKLDSMDSDTRLHYLEDCYDDHFIYRVTSRGGEPGEQFYKRSYEIDNNKIEFTGEPQAVTKRVEYVAMSEAKGDEAMPKDNKEAIPCCPEKVELLIQNEQTKFEEADREWLLTLSEEQIDKLVPKEAPAQEVLDMEKEREEILRMSQDQAIKVLEEKLADPQKAMALFPEEIQEQLRFGLKAYKAERAKLIEHITASAPEVYTTEELEGKTMDELSKLAKLAKPKMDFSLMAPSTPAAYEQEILLPLGVE